LLPENDMLFVVELLVENKLSAHSITAGKKYWSKEYTIHEISDFDEKHIIGIVKDENEQWNISIIDKKNGIIIQKHYLTKFEFDKRFTARLWEGAKIVKTAGFMVITYSPNEIWLIKDGKTM